MNFLEKSIESFLTHCKVEKNLSPKSIDAYRIDLYQYCSFLKKKDLQNGEIDVGKDGVRSWLKTLSDELKPSSQKRKVATLKIFFSYLEQEELIESNPMRLLKIRIKIPQTLPNYLSLEEMRKILACSYACLSNLVENSSEKYRLTLRDVAVIEMLFATGIRVSELCSIKPEDIDLIKGIILIRGKGSKERYIYLGHDKAMKIITRYERSFFREIAISRSFFVNRLGNPLQPPSVRMLIRKYAGLAKIAKNVTPHTFRHTFATLLMDEGVDIKYIQKFLGHSSIVTTQIYTHVSQKKVEEILVTRHPRRKIL